MLAVYFVFKKTVTNNYTLRSIVHVMLSMAVLSALGAKYKMIPL